MIDIRTHVMALGIHEAALAGTPIPDPAAEIERFRLLQDVSGNRGAAVVGALIDHLFRHAAADGRELGLLARAEQMWTEGMNLYTAISKIRGDVEAALDNPGTPASAARFCGALKRLRRLREQVEGRQLDIQALGGELAKMDHIPEHGRQTGRPLEEWNWADVFLARRTDAFVRAAFRNANTPATRAMAFGILSSYSANVYGSAYLTRVVGGPRRSHRFRSRLASTTMGSWFAQQHPEIRNCDDIADAIQFGPGEPALPAELKDFLDAVVADTYDLGQIGPAPDLAAGYVRLMRQLRTLDVFRPPAPPTLPAPRFIQADFADPAAPPTPVISPETATPPAAHAPGIHPTTYSGQTPWPTSRPPTPTDSTADSDNACGSFWLGVLGWLALTGVACGPCWGDWADGRRCEFWDKHIRDNFQNAFVPGSLSPEEVDALAQQYQDLTTPQLTKVADNTEVVALAGMLFDFQNRLWEGLGKAAAYLSNCGLIYPDGRLQFPLFRQFLGVPGDVSDPHRPEPDPAPTFYRYPPTPLERPVSGSELFSPGDRPDKFLRPSTTLLTGIVKQILAGPPDERNLDLDADRWPLHDCWEIGGSIDDDPVSVQPLAYTDL